MLNIIRLNTMWIEKKDKNEYCDSRKKGLRIVFRSGTDNGLRTEILSFAKWLRKRYWFPIRVEIRFLNHEEFCINENKSVVALFNYQTNWDNVTAKEKACPLVYIAMGKYRNQLKKHGFEETIYNYIFSVVHELTHYYQWYFYEFEKRSSKSLETEANSWAYLLAGEFMSGAESLSETVKLRR